jgi:hypothetical protein
MDTRVTTILKSHPYEYSPLVEAAHPVSIEDMVMQMDALVGDNSDVEVCHKEADRLLVSALHLLSGRETIFIDEQTQIKALINSFYTVRKWYA